eukprot:Clim_evm7s50 gene=Clim_evmTU7s50
MAFFPKSWRKSLIGTFAEFWGTLLFLLITIGTALNSTVFTQELGDARYLSISMSFGFAIAVIVYGTAHISGGHINPAVTFALMVFGKTDLVTGIFYICAQCLGAIIGVGIVRGITPEEREGNFAINEVFDPSTANEAFWGEVFFTALLVFVVFSTVVDGKFNKNVGGGMAPFAIGMSVMLAHFVMIPIDNCSINPARSLGSAVVAEDFTDDFWVFVIGPIVGGLIGGALAYIPQVMLWPEEEEDKEEVLPLTNARRSHSDDKVETVKNDDLPAPA